MYYLDESEMSGTGLIYDFYIFIFMIAFAFDLQHRPGNVFDVHLPLLLFSKDLQDNQIMFLVIETDAMQ